MGIRTGLFFVSQVSRKLDSFFRHRNNLLNEGSFLRKSYFLGPLGVNLRYIVISFSGNELLATYCLLSLLIPLLLHESLSTTVCNTYPLSDSRLARTFSKPTHCRSSFCFLCFPWFSCCCLRISFKIDCFSPPFCMCVPCWDEVPGLDGVLYQAYFLLGGIPHHPQHEHFYFSESLVDLTLSSLVSD